MKIAHAVVSTYHLVMKFPIDIDVKKVRGSYVMARKCYFVAVKRKSKTKETFIVSSKIKVKQNLNKVETTEAILKVKLDMSERINRMGSQMIDPVKKSIKDFIKNNYVMMTYKLEEIKGISLK